MTDNVEIELPIVVGGRIIELGDRPRSHLLEYEHGLAVRLPALEAGDIDKIVAGRAKLMNELSGLTMFDVTSLLSAVGMRMFDRSNEVRAEAELDAARLTGFPQRMIVDDYNGMASLFAHRPYAYDLFQAQLGHEFIMDEWHRSQEAWIRAFPRGIVVHFLVGNLPMASVGSLYYGCVAKNVNVAKLPARDPITPVAFARQFVEVDPEHPITRGLTVAYWGHDARVAEQALDHADAVCVWGGRDAVESVKHRVPANVPVVEFGPRWSVAVVDIDRCDIEAAAWRLATDSSYYDQEACFSPQRVFVKGAEVETFVERLCHYYAVAARTIPKESLDPDPRAHLAMTRLEGAFRGWTAHASDDWTVFVVDDPEDVVEHPLGRTMFVHPVESVNSVVEFLSPAVQTLSCDPWELGIEHRDNWCTVGVDRIAALGQSRIPRLGFTHDGMHALGHLVRLACHQTSLHDHYKYGDIRGTADENERSWFFRD